MIFQRYCLEDGKGKEINVWQGQEIWIECNFLSAFEGHMWISVSSLSEPNMTHITSLNVNCYTDTAEIFEVKLRKKQCFSN